MELRICGDKYWIKDDVPSNFNSMTDIEKWSYVWGDELVHRIDGPAVIYPNGTEWWYLNGKMHRIDGPAVIWDNGIKEWYLYGRKVDGEIYKKIQNSSKEELLVYMIDTKYKNYLPLIEYRLGIYEVKNI